MSEIRIEVRGTQRVGNKLRKLAAMNKEVINPTVKDWGKKKAKQLRGKKYPPTRPGQTYVRTGQLGKRWRAMNPKPPVVQFINLAQRKGRKYAGYVVGKTQAWMHAGRWWKAKDVIGQDAPRLVDALTKQLRKLING